MTNNAAIPISRIFSTLQYSSHIAVLQIKYVLWNWNTSKILSLSCIYFQLIFRHYWNSTGNMSREMTMHQLKRNAWKTQRKQCTKNQTPVLRFRGTYSSVQRDKSQCSMNLGTVRKTVVCRACFHPGYLFKSRSSINLWILYGTYL